MDNLVSTDWLAAELGKDDVLVLDASVHLPGVDRDPAAEFAAAHIPGARFMALKSLVDGDSSTPSALPTPDQFAGHMTALGVNERMRVVLYDDSDIRSAARGWFMCRMNGMQQVAILDGGLGKWRSEGRALESGTTPAAAGQFAAHDATTTAAVTSAVRSKADMLANIASKAEQVIDARGPGRFAGEEEEPRAGMAAGHIPGSCNLPFSALLNGDGTYRKADAIRAAFSDAGIDLGAPVIATCGSGITASVLLFALHLLGKQDTAVYDGSWAEWGADSALPVATGAAV